MRYQLCMRYGKLLPLLFILLATNTLLGTNWERTYGDKADNYARSVQQTKDSGYIVAGGTHNVLGRDADLWVFRLDASSNIVWQKKYRITSRVDDEFANSVQQTKDGGSIVSGYTFRDSNYDFWVLKLDGMGNIEWQKSYGGDGFDMTRSVSQTKDGGYIVAGDTDEGEGGDNILVLKLDKSGNIVWQNSYGGSGFDSVRSAQQTQDGGYIVAGDIFFRGEDSDVWILKLDAVGDVEWQATYGGSADEYARSLQQTKDGGYIVASDTDSFGAGGSEAWLFKLDAEGDVVWQKAYGGNGLDFAGGVTQTHDGGYVLAGSTTSFGQGSVCFESGDACPDFWLLKLDPEGNVQWQKTYGAKKNEFANSVQQTNDGGYLIAGESESFGRGDLDTWLLKLDESGNIASCRTPIVIKESSAKVTNTRAGSAKTSILPASTQIEVNSQQTATEITTAKLTSHCGARINSLIPASTFSQNEITIRGLRFGSRQGSHQLLFGNIPATDIISWGKRRIQARVPEKAVTGPVFVSIDGTLSSGPVDNELVIAPSAPSVLLPAFGTRTGGTRVAIRIPADTGREFTIFFGSSPAESLKIVRSDLVTCTSPAGKRGKVQVSLSTQLATIKLGEFTYK